MMLSCRPAYSSSENLSKGRNLAACLASPSLHVLPQMRKLENDVSSRYLERHSEEEISRNTEGIPTA